MSCHVFFARVSASVLTTGLASENQAGCCDRRAGFMTASLGSSVNTGDVAFRFVSISPTFPSFTSASLSERVLKNALASTSGSLLPCFFGLYLFQVVMQRVIQFLKLVCV